MKLYIAGPMTGLPDNNYPAFHEAARGLRAGGHEVMNPAEVPDGCEGYAWEQWMRRAITMLLECEGVAVLPGWQASRGARIEVNLALELGMGIYPVVDDGVAE